MSEVTAVGFFFFALFAWVECYPSGAPLAVCKTMAPNPSSNGGHGALPQNTPSPFAIDVNSSYYTKDGVIHVTIKPCSSEIEGFMLQARNESSDEAVGKFISIPAMTKYLDCTSANTTVTHSDELEIEGSHTLEFVWVSGIDNPTKKITFYATLVKGKKTYWVKQKSATIMPDDGTGVSNTPSNQMCPVAKSGQGFKSSAACFIIIVNYLFIAINY